MRAQRLFCLLLCAGFLLGMAPPAPAAEPASPVPPAANSSPPDRDLIAVLELEPVGASKAVASAITDRLREALLDTGRFTLVNRDQMDAILNEQALQQTGCTSQECAVKVGRILGVRQMVAGRVTQLDSTHWLLAATLLDVESAQTLKAVSVPFQGDSFALMQGGTAELAARLAEPGGAPLVVSDSSNQTQLQIWRLKWISTGVLAVVLAAYSYGQAQTVSSKNSDENDALTKAKAATTQAQLDSYRSQISDDASAAKNAAAQSNDAALLAVLASAYAIYEFSAKPESQHRSNPSTFLLPSPALSGQGWQLTWIARY